MEGGRPARGRAYARKGQVIDFTVRPGAVDARVQGSRQDPYVVRLTFPVVPDDVWGSIAEALASRAGHAARMLAGELPHEIEDVFEAAGASLFPAPGARLVTACTCPDWENPCKHVAAVFYLLAEGFDADPFVLLAWRGREREALLRELRTARAGLPEETAPEEAPPEEAPPREAGEASGAGAERQALEAEPPQTEKAARAATFWSGGADVLGVRFDPNGSSVAGAVLRQLPRGVLDLAGRDVHEVLAPAYRAMAAAAVERAQGRPDARPPRRGRNRRRSAQGSPIASQPCQTPPGASHAT